MLSEKTRRRMMRVWVLLGFAMFSVRYLDQAKSFAQRMLGGDAPPASKSGQVVVESPAASIARDPNQQLTLASWNLEWLDVPGRGTVARGEKDYAALRRYAQRLDADVIAVQEVANEDALAQVFPRDVYAYHLARTGGGQRAGFVYRKALHVEVQPDAEALALHDLRGGADIRVRIGGRTLELLSIHLKAFCATEPLDTNSTHCEKLRAQLPALEAWVDARASEGQAFAVLGDFNRVLGVSDDALFRELDDGEPAKLSLKRASTRTQTRCRGGKTLPAIDHVVLGGSATQAMVDPGFVEVSYAPGDVEAGLHLSDHCPISVSLDPRRL